jgi:hypothetical protein
MPAVTLRQVKGSRSSDHDPLTNRLWAAVSAFSGIFLLLWGLSWVGAALQEDDLRSHCMHRVHEASFPVERSCTYADGRVVGETGTVFGALFYGSLAAAAACLIAVLAIEQARRARAS